MAQSYFKRAIASLVAYVIALFVYAIVNSNIPFGEYHEAVTTEITTWTFSVWYVYVTSILIVISLVMSSIALYKANKKDANDNQDQ